MSAPTPDNAKFQTPETAVRPDPVPAEGAAVVNDIASGAPVGQVVQDVGTLAGDPQFAELAGEIPQVVQETRRGYRTSEFWGVVLAAFATVGPIDTSSKDKIIVSGLAVLYAIARGIAKHGVPNITPVPPA